VQLILFQFLVIRFLGILGETLTISLVGVPPASKLLLLEPVKYPLVLLKVNGSSPINSGVDAAGSFQTFLVRIRMAIDFLGQVVLHFFDSLEPM
jgi:hypothetical protein